MINHRYLIVSPFWPRNDLTSSTATNTMLTGSNCVSVSLDGA